MAFRCIPVPISVRDDLYVIVKLIYNNFNGKKIRMCTNIHLRAGCVGRTPRTIAFYLVISKFPTRLQNQNVIKYYQFVLEE